MQLYSYWRSTTAYRVRIALALKGLSYDTRAVDLARGDQLDEAYARVNPIAGVPTLVLVDGRVLTQSMAILDYLDRMHPSPPLLPEDPFAAAQVRAAAYVIASCSSGRATACSSAPRITSSRSSGVPAGANHQ